MRLVGALDPCFGWSPDAPTVGVPVLPGASLPGALLGAAATVQSDPSGRCRLLRDPLGLNKLFWARDPEGKLVVAARPKRLTDAGCRFESIVAIAPGTVVDLGGEAPPEVLRLTTAVADRPAGDAPLDLVASSARAAVDGYMEAVAHSERGRTAYVCASGGLDSTGILALAQEHFSDVVAVSFDLRTSGVSEDRRTAERLAKHYGIPLLAVDAGEDLLDYLDTVLTEGIDWRDFNVHAALVNAALAEGIAGAGEGLVLTGDLMNEFLADYHEEHYRGQAYYRLPRLPIEKLRHALVRGVETSHREVGVFMAWDLPVVQPYAAAVDTLAYLPARILRSSDRKRGLAREMFATAIPDYVYQRKKSRAQLGNATAGGGVLALAVDRGIDAGWLKQRFATLHGIADSAQLNMFIRSGRYRTAVPLNGDSTS